MFFIDNKDPEVSTVSSLVPKSNKIPISTVDGIPSDSVNTLIPLFNFVNSHFNGYSLATTV